MNNKMSSVRCSILMAVYNAERYLTRALDSLLSEQTMKDIEVLAVDDASTDQSLSILQCRAAKDSRLRVFVQTENHGQAVARNLALQHARGEFICMVDADDWLSPDAISQSIGVFEAHPEADCVLFRLINHWQESGREEEFPQITELSGAEAFRLSLNWSIHGLYMIRRELHIQYPYDDSLRLYSDDNTTHLHFLHSRRVYQSQGIYYYRHHAESCTTSFSPLRFLHMQANLLLRNIELDFGLNLCVQLMIIS